MSERKILITITSEMWDDDDQEWLVERMNALLHDMLYYQDYTLLEFE